MYRKKILSYLCLIRLIRVPLQGGLLSLLLFSCGQPKAQEKLAKEENSNHAPVTETVKKQSVVTGAEQMEKYLPLLKGKKVALVVNQTSLIQKTHLADSLLTLGIELVRIFSPEHGFRGDADAGEHVASGKDIKTGTTITSLYGKNKKPTTEQLKDVDWVVYDIQDVGVRCYTYISTMSYMMEACAENHVKMLIVDRPNPNGNYIDGPVLEKKYTSFVGLHEVPVVYGMTAAEYAKMLNGEGWLSGAKQCELTVIPCKNYTHDTYYELPVAPSPNLRSMKSILLYPSIFFFEGTVISEGRGTEQPFCNFGHPDLPNEGYSFVPRSGKGAKSPKLEGKTCYGKDLSGLSTEELFKAEKIDISYLLDAYKKFPKEKTFFNADNFFNTLAGNSQLMEQIKAGKSEEEIRNSWKPALDKFKNIRSKYLIY